MTATVSMHTVKFGPTVSEICERTDRQTDKFITILRSPPGCSNNKLTVD